ncbi:hypothetical protein SNE40_007493 [Patella caerulea]|uniref:UNC93-like protein n=3 Tax=Patella caerulea TaxID=87958 RepID=A0AAN8K3P1_PATCE
MAEEQTEPSTSGTQSLNTQPTLETPPSMTDKDLSDLDSTDEETPKKDQTNDNDDKINNKETTDNIIESEKNKNMNDTEKSSETDSVGKSKNILTTENNNDLDDTEDDNQIEDESDTQAPEKDTKLDAMELEEKSKDVETGTQADISFPMTRFQILKNLAVVSLGFFCLFTAFISISNLQTSLNIDDGVGPGSLSIIYGALVLSCMFLPPFIIAHLGCKWTIPLSMIGYVLYMGANMHAIWALMAPAAVLLGLGAAPLWSAKCTYLTQTGVWYAQMTGQSKDAVINRFFGIFFMTFQASQISGNLVSSLVFSQNNTDLNLSNDMLQRCGANFDPRIHSNNTNLVRPDADKVYIVCGVYLGFAVLAAIIVILLLDKLPIEKDKDAKPSFSLLISTFRHLATSPAQMLLIPLTVYSGAEQAFFAGDFTRSYVTCSLGIWNVGYIAICYGIVDAFCCYTFGRLVQYVGHIPFFILAAILHGCAQVVMLLWTPDPSVIYVYYVLAALWGMGDAVIQTQINALYGLLFTDNTEAAFANYRLWESVGFIFSFAYNDYIPTYIKLYVCMGALSVGMAGYSAVEFLQRNKSSKSYNISD